MTSFFNDVNPRHTTRSPRGIMRVVVVIATVLGLAGVVGFAPGAGGELQREAAGVMPIVDAGNYVGTELGERLSNNGGMDLSWPRPEGFDGIWFEKEPYGRREHVVWESQRFVGEPVDIPKLKQGQVKGEFVGLPDICGPVVRERMAELGYTDDEGLDSNYDYRYGCTYVNYGVERAEQLDTIAASLGTPMGDLEEYRGEIDYQLSRESTLVVIASNPDAVACVARGTRLRDEHRLYVQSGNINVKSREANCKNSAFYWQVFNNVLGES